MANIYQDPQLIANADSPLYDQAHPDGDRGAPAGDWQLSAGQFAPSRISLAWVNPNGSETSRSAYLWAHSEFDYSRAITVVGGSPPYNFTLQSPVAGVTINRVAPLWNPGLYLWARLLIDHSQFTSGSKTFTIVCQDQNLTEITLELTVTVDNTKFVFANASASPGGDGSFASPYQGVDDIYTTDDTDATHAGKMIVLSSGTYTISNFDTGNTGLPLNTNKPSGWIPLPGASVVLDCNANITTTGVDDQYFGEVEYLGSDSSASNARVFGVFGSQNNLVWDTPIFTDPVSGTVANDNESCIYTANAGASAHGNMCIVDATWDGLPNSSNGFSMFDWFGSYTSCVVGGSVRNSNFSFGAWAKGNNTNLMVAGIDAYSATNSYSRVFFPQQADAGDLSPSGVVQYIGIKAYRATDGLNSQAVIAGGDSNQNWGTIYYDRVTGVGRFKYENGDTNSLGAMNLNSSFAFNGDSPAFPSEWSGSGNVSGARSAIGDYLDSNGDVLVSVGEYGTVGANFVDTEAA